MQSRVAGQGRREVESGRQASSAVDKAPAGQRQESKAEERAGEDIAKVTIWRSAGRLGGDCSVAA